MAIKPVSGEIKAQALNNNFSDLQSQILQTRTGPIDTLSSLTQLNQKYPNGANGTVVVLESDGKTGYEYTWTDGAWKKGAIRQADGIPDLSIKREKLSDKAVTAEKLMLDGNLATDLIFESGTIDFGGLDSVDNRRLRSKNFVKVLAGQIVKINHANLTISGFYYSEPRQSAGIGQLGTFVKSFVVPSDCYLRLNARNVANDTSIIDFVYTLNNYITIDYVAKDVISNAEMIKNNIISLDKLDDNLQSLIGTAKGVDLIVFAGQSNMAGRGQADLSPLAQKAYEYRAISDPTKLYPLIEPFGRAENKTGGIDDGTRKTGSLVSSLVSDYQQLTNRTVVAVSASEGSTSIDDWQSSGRLLPDAINRFNDAVAFLTDEGYTISNKWLVFCQGEEDGNLATDATVYNEKLKLMLEIFSAAGIDHSFLIRIGNHRDDAVKYKQIIQAQTNFCEITKGVTLIATNFDKMASENLMSDPWHYTQAGYNLCGSQAGINLAYYQKNKKEPNIYDWTNKELYYSQKT